MRHPLLRPLHGGPTDPRRYATRVSGWQPRDDASSMVLLAAAQQLLSQIQPPSERSGLVRIDDIEELENVHLLTDLALRMMPDVVTWCVMSTYDVNGSFKPGQIVVWEGRHTLREAEEALPLWRARQHPKSKDVYGIRYMACPLYKVRRPGVPGGPTP